MKLNQKKLLILIISERLQRKILKNLESRRFNSKKWHFVFFVSIPIINIIIITGQNYLYEYDIQFFGSFSHQDSDILQNTPSSKDIQSSPEKKGVNETCILIEYLLDKSQYPIPTDGGKFGRNKDNDIVLLDQDVSRKHAEIFFLENKFYIKDLGSSVGTFTKIQKHFINEKDMVFVLGNHHQLIIKNLLNMKLNFSIVNEEEEDENEKNQEIDFEMIDNKKPIIIGKASNSNIRIFAGKNNISDRHCALYKNDNSQIVLEDLDSNSGFFFKIIIIFCLF